MEDFIDLCLARQSCRKFADRPVEREKLVRCAEAARLAPSGCNAQPWSFVLVRDPAAVQGVAEATQQLELNEYTSAAKAFFVIVEEHAVLIPRLRRLIDSQYFADFDVGAAANYICLEAEAQGLGTCMLGIFDREKLSQLLGIPAEKQIRLVIAVGYPADGKLRAKVRKPLDEVLRVIE